MNSQSFRILLAVDGSEHSLAATRLLRDLPLSQGTDMTALAVLSPLAAARHGALQAVLDHIKALFADAGLQINTQLQVGYPAETISNFIDSRRPDLIVLGAKGLRATLGILLGGVAQQVVEYANCPVLVVRAPYGGLKSVLVATDGSPHSQRSAAYLARFPLPYNLDVTVVHVLPPIYSIEPILQTWPVGEELFRPIPEQTGEEREAFLEEERQGKALLDQTILALSNVGVRVTGKLLRGDAATEIIHTARDLNVDLLVAGSRGLTRMQGWLLGSVSRKLVHYAGCSVLIVKSMPESE